MLAHGIEGYRPLLLVSHPSENGPAKEIPPVMVTIIVPYTGLSGLLDESYELRGPTRIVAHTWHDLGKLGMKGSCLKSYVQVSCRGQLKCDIS